MMTGKGRTMGTFRKRRSFGPKISLTERQIAKLQHRCNVAGLTCDVENSGTGSCYISIGLPSWEQNINNQWYSNLGCGCSDNVAKIRLSGHEEGRITDSTHNCVGAKGQCLTALKGWVSEIIDQRGSEARAVLANRPDGALAPGQCECGGIGCANCQDFDK